VVRAHASEKALALVELEGLLQEARRLTPVAQVLVDDAEVVEGRDQPVGVVDAAEGGGGVLQPFDRSLMRPSRAQQMPSRTPASPTVRWSSVSRRTRYA
jgi:hypothetical protein